MAPEMMTGLLADHGLWIVALASVAEGPIVSVLAAFQARQGVFEILPLALALLAGDLLGDLGFYLLGRQGLDRLRMSWRHRLGLGPARTASLARHFDRYGGRTLILGKLTHSAGAAVLVAAGLTRMPVRSFLTFNLIAALPKTAALMALGYFAGDATAQIDLWLGRGATVMLLAISLGASLLSVLRRRPCPPACRNGAASRPARYRCKIERKLAPLPYRIQREDCGMTCLSGWMCRWRRPRLA